MLIYAPIVCLLFYLFMPAPHLLSIADILQKEPTSSHTTKLPHLSLLGWLTALLFIKLSRKLYAEPKLPETTSKEEVSVSRDSLYQQLVLDAMTSKLGQDRRPHPTGFKMPPISSLSIFNDSLIFSDSIRENPRSSQSSNDNCVNHSRLVHKLGYNQTASGQSTVTATPSSLHHQEVQGSNATSDFKFQLFNTDDYLLPPATHPFWYIYTNILRVPTCDVASRSKNYSNADRDMLFSTRELGRIDRDI